jgi:hypothetical protein
MSFFIIFRYDYYPLDSQVCPFIVHSNYQTDSVIFDPMRFYFNTTKKSILVEYGIGIEQHSNTTQDFPSEADGNISYTGLHIVLSR